MCDNCVLTDSCNVAMSHVKITELGFVFKMEFGIRLRFFLIWWIYFVWAFLCFEAGLSHSNTHKKRTYEKTWLKRKLKEVGIQKYLSYRCYLEKNTFRIFFSFHIKNAIHHIIVGLSLPNFKWRFNVDRRKKRSSSCPQRESSTFYIVQFVSKVNTKLTPCSLGPLFQLWQLGSLSINMN